MASKKKDLKSQVRALEALAGLAELDETTARDVNGGLGATAGTGTAVAGKPVLPPPKLRKGTGAIAIRRGTGAVAVFKGTGAIAVRPGFGA